MSACLLKLTVAQDLIGCAADALPDEAGKVACNICRLIAKRTEDPLAEDRCRTVAQGCGDLQLLLAAGDRLRAKERGHLRA